MRRDKVVSCRLTEDEHRQLIERAERAGLELSDFVRELLADEPQQPPTPFPIRPETHSVSAPARSNIIWLSDGHRDGGTLTVRCA